MFQMGTLQPPTGTSRHFQVPSVCFRVVGSWGRPPYRKLSRRSASSFVNGIRCWGTSPWPSRSFFSDAKTGDFSNEKKSSQLGPMFGGIKLDAKLNVWWCWWEFRNFPIKSALMLVWVGFIYNDHCSKQSLKETGVLFRAPTVPCGTKKTYPPPQRGKALWKTEVLSSPRIGKPRKHGFPKLFFQNEIWCWCLFVIGSLELVLSW